MRTLRLLIVFPVLAACATTEAYEKILSSYVGTPESALIAQWGPPHSVYESGGTKYLTYSDSRTVSVPGTPPAYSTTCNFGYCTSFPVGGSSGYTAERRCRTTFEVRGGAVTSWRHQGNDCVAWAS